ncbi:unnamed protein product [Ambrosiozyma monospora]|uniref:Unnamed protein product n=1 Tax=Ambrosiozyma monospora TaxID=43982 RepID=A0ACB5TC09_AMBMO|nr:unnamed protein product [Ambrosiozyma monospora]
MIESLIKFGKLNFAITELQLFYQDLSHVLGNSPSRSSKPSTSRMLEGFEYKPMVYSSYVITLVFMFHLQVLNLCLLKASTASSTKVVFPSGQEMMRFLSKGSSFNKWFGALPKDTVPRFAKLTSTCLFKLSMYTKTVLKLCYKLMSLQYLAYTSEVSDELIGVCTKIFRTMSSTNASVVYKYTSPTLLNVCESFKINDIPLTKLIRLIESYGSIAPIKEKSIWNAYKEELSDDNSDNIENLLEGLDIKSTKNMDSLIQLFESCQSWNLLGDVHFCASVAKTVKTLDLRDTRSQKFASAFLDFVNNASDENVDFGTKVFSVLDMFTIKIKSLDPIQHTEFCYSSLNSMFTILRTKSQPKRLRNFSNLAFHFGGLLLTSSVDQSLRFWMACVNFEYNVMLQAGDDEKHQCFQFLKTNVYLL